MPKVELANVCVDIVKPLREDIPPPAAPTASSTRMTSPVAFTESTLVPATADRLADVKLVKRSPELPAIP